MPEPTKRCDHCARLERRIAEQRIALNSLNRKPRWGTARALVRKNGKLKSKLTQAEFNIRESEARASALADALRDLLGREAAVSRMREMPSHTAESLRCVEDALERSIVAARSALADAAVPLPHKENT